ncbi:MAG: hypothetical protein ABSE58_08340 [Candidatus Limnocylindrales bacterium]|jgi:hypothetical protein
MSQQFVVQLPNRPGELAHLAKALCARGVNIVQVHQTTAGNLTCTEIYTDCCDDDTTEVLKSMGYPFVAGPGLTIEIEDTACALGEVSDRLAHAGVNIKGCCILGRANGIATWALSVDKENRAREVLGIPPAVEEPETVAH